MKTHVYLCSALILIGQVLNAQSWYSMGAGLNGPVYEIVIHEDDVYVGGHFQNAGGDPDADFVARWDGCDWHAVAPGLKSAVNAIAVVEDRIYVAGNFTDVADNPDIDGIAFWDGVQWNALGSGLDYYVSDMEVIGTDLYVGGGFNSAGGEVICIIARWDGSVWHELGPGPTNCAYDFAYVSDMATDGVNLYVVGLFSNIGGIESADRVARWDGMMWHGLGDGIPLTPLWSDDLSVVVDDNHVYVAGEFRNAGGNEEADYLVVWDGSAWAGLAQSLSDSTARKPFILQGDLHCVFGNEIRRWDEKAGAWIVIASIDLFYTLTSDGQNLYVGGFFNEIDGQTFGRIARWGEEHNCTTSTENETSTDSQLMLNLYPNPSGDMLSYTLKGIQVEEISISISDTRGNTVLNTKTVAREIEVSSLCPGVYFIEIRDEPRSWRGKFVKL